MRQQTVNGGGKEQIQNAAEQENESADYELRFGFHGSASSGNIYPQINIQAYCNTSWKESEPPHCVNFKNCTKNPLRLQGILFVQFIDHIHVTHHTFLKAQAFINRATGLGGI